MSGALSSMAEMYAEGMSMATASIRERLRPKRFENGNSDSADFPSPTNRIAPESRSITKVT
jgi:hypothetical protein